MTSPVSGAGSAPDLPGYAAIARSAQSETGRAASRGATADGGKRRLGLALPVIATGLFGLFFLLTHFIQSVLGYSAVRSGIAYLPLGRGQWPARPGPGCGWRISSVN